MRRNAVDPDLKYIKVVAIAAPFIGYLSAHLIKLGEVGYFRIPSSYVAVGLEDALVSGALIIVAALVGLSLFTYFKGLRTHHPKAEQGIKPVFVKALEGVVLFLLLAAISIAVVYLVVWVNNVMMSSVANLSGRDACFTAIYAVGLVFFIFASVLLYHSELGRSLKELQVPGGLMGLKIKHLVVGFAGILIVGGFCFLYGYGTASSAHPFPYCADRQVVLVQAYPGDKVVIAHVGGGAWDRLWLHVGRRLRIPCPSKRSVRPGARGCIDIPMGDNAPDSCQ